MIDEQVRGEQRRVAGGLVEAVSEGGLKPWREVVTPHADVASGRYQQAEFAADLWQVKLGEGAEEYRDPGEFFRRTFLTGSLRQLLAGAARRLAGQGGDPVVQLQTNFGGGKTHSMLALYHLFSGIPARELAGMEEVLGEVGGDIPPEVRRVVLVGTRISPGNPVTKDDGTVVRTLWGELAYQLGGKPAFERLRADDERATSPGDVLRELLNEHGPCLVLIDEWVSYARQLHDGADLPAGSFETQFTFAQALTETVKVTGNCLLVISLPASDTTDSGSPHTEADDAEVGGPSRTRRPGPAAQRAGPGGRAVEAGQRRGELRDRAPSAVRASRRGGRLQAARPDGPRLRGAVPATAGGVSHRVPHRRLRAPPAGRLPHPSRDLRSPLHGLVLPRPIPAHPRRAAAHGGRDPQPLGAGGPQPAAAAPPPSPSTTTACATS